MTVIGGSYRSGSAASLRALDGATFQVGGFFSTDWYGDSAGVPNSASTLTVTYNGSNSVPCMQTVSVYNWTFGSWSALDTRSVGTPAATITAPVPDMTSDYVSGSTGTGVVSVRVQCSGGFFGDFSSSGDLMKVTYGS